MPINPLKQTIGGIDTYVIQGDPDAAAVVLFHGFGATAEDLVPLSQVYKDEPKLNWFFPQGPLEIPIMPGYVGRAWFPIDIERLKKALQDNDEEEMKRAFPSSLVEIRQTCIAFLSEIGIPFSKIFLGGFSQGAMLATEVALHHFENIAGLLIFSGALLNHEEWEKLAHIHAGMPFFQSHGKNDPLLPFKNAEALEKLLLAGGMKGSLQAFAGGHDIPSSILIKLNHFFAHTLKSH